MNFGNRQFSPFTFAHQKNKPVRFRLTFVFVCVVTLTGLTQTPSPYHLTWKKELAFYGTGLTTFATGAWLRGRTPVFTADELTGFRQSDVNGFDQAAFDYFSPESHRASNILWYGSVGMPLLLLTKKGPRADFMKMGWMWSETLFITGGLTLLSKYSVRRARPYVYDENTDLSKKTTVNAKASFFSGHTSMTAANAFFAATVFSDYYPESKWKPIVWGVAVTLPAVTGYLRVRGGRHFPTDVLAGYAVGALVGWGVPRLHRASAGHHSNVRLSGGWNSLAVQITW